MSVGLTSSELKQLADFGCNLTRLEGIAQVGEYALEILASVFRADQSVFFMVHHDQKPVFKSMVSRGCEKRYWHGFTQYYYKLDPFAEVVGPLQSRAYRTAVYTTDQLVSFSKFTNSEFYNDFFKPQNVHDKLCLYLGFGEDLAVVGFLRSKSRPPFSEQDRIKAELISPYFRAALEKAFALQQKNFIIQSIEEEVTHKGVAIVDEALKPVYMNEVARGIVCILNHEEEEKKGNQDLCRLPPQLHRRLEAYAKALRLNPAQGSAAGELHLDILSEDKAHYISVRLRSVSPFHCGRLFLLTMEARHSKACDGSSPERPRLSKREIQVALLASEGLTNAQIAQKLFISKNTVITHLRTIFSKMKVNNRTSLARLIYPPRGSIDCINKKSFAEPS